MMDSRLADLTKVAVQKAREAQSGQLYWDADRYIDKKTGRILAIIELQSGYCNVLINGEVRGQFVSSAQAKRWVEEQNL